MLSDVDLNRTYRYHLENNALATLAVQARPTSRYFLFDTNETLCGWESVSDNKKMLTRAPADETRRCAFNGIHVISPKIFPFMHETGTFSINETYLRLAGTGEKFWRFTWTNIIGGTLGDWKN